MHRKSAGTVSKSGSTVSKSASTVSMTRKGFLYGLAGLAAASGTALRAEAAEPAKALLVVAHPDDEYAFAATTYRLAKELGGIVDQVVITNGEAGYRYSQLAESFYGVSLTREDAGRSRLPEIRKRETLAAGRVLGIRKHYFLDQRDARYTLDRGEAARIWDTHAVTDFLVELLRRERYSFVFVLLPTATTHGHHQEAAALTLEAVARIPEEQRPAVLGAEPARADDPLPAFEGHAGAPVFVFDRRTRFGFNGALNYQIVVHWMVAEHKSQGLFQTEQHDVERYWLLDGSGRDALGRTRALFERLGAHAIESR